MDDREFAHEQRKLAFEAWKSIVDVQMHFNDMVMRVRNLAITLLAAIFGAAALSLEKNLYFHVFNRDIHIAFWIICFGTLAWLGVGLMDWGYYNRLLLGAVKKATDIEEQNKIDPIFGMVGMITEESRRVGPFRIYARHKILFFYLFIALVTLSFGYLILRDFPRRSFDQNQGAMPRILKAEMGRCGKSEENPERDF
jgi:hypothetical protein